MSGQRDCSFRGDSPMCIAIYRGLPIFNGKKVCALAGDLFAEQEFERGICCFKGKSARLHLFDPFYNAGHHCFISTKIDSELLRLKFNRGATSHFRDQHPHIVSDARWIFMLIHRRINFDGASMQTCFVSEGRCTYIRLARTWCHICHLSDRM